MHAFRTLSGLYEQQRQSTTAAYRDRARKWAHFAQAIPNSYHFLFALAIARWFFLFAIVEELFTSYKSQSFPHWTHWICHIFGYDCIFGSSVRLNAMHIQTSTYILHTKHTMTNQNNKWNRFVSIENIFSGLFSQFRRTEVGKTIISFDFISHMLLFVTHKHIVKSI